MKILRFLPLLLLMLLTPSSKAQTLIQTCSNASFGDGANCTFPNPVGAHHHIITSVVTYDGACGSGGSLTDTLVGGHYGIETDCANYSGNFLSMTLYCVNTRTSSGSDTLQPAGLFGGGYLVSAEYSGLATTGLAGDQCAVDGHSGAGSTTAGSGPITTGSITTTIAGDLLVTSGWYYLTANAGLTVPTGYTSEVYYNTCTGCSNTVAHMLADKIGASIGTYAPTFAMATSGNWIGTQAAFLLSAPATVATQIGGFLTGP